MSRRPHPIENPNSAEAFDQLRADYNAAKQSRFRRRRAGVSATGRSADYHVRSDGDFLRIMETSRDFFRNDIVVGQGVRRLVGNIVRDGFNVDPQTGNPDIDAHLSERFVSWSQDAEQCDVAGESTFHDQEKLVLQSTVVDGDIFALLTDGPAMQLTEAHRCRTPRNTRRNVVHGVLLDENRRRLEYWMTKDDIDPLRPLAKVSETTPKPARNKAGHRRVLHVYRADRVSQTRGISHLAPCSDTVGMHDDVQFAKLVQQQIVSCFAIIRTRDGSYVDGEAPPTGERSTETLADGTMRTLQGAGPGMEIQGQPGEIINGFSPNVPNAEFFDHAQLLLTFIAINLGLPVAVLLLDPSNTNFSGWRGAMDQARIGFRDIQMSLISKFHSPVYTWKVRQWLAEDADLRAAVKAGIPIFKHRFNPPAWPYIEPLKDAAADLLRTKNALISQRRRCHERGMDWDELSTEIVEDNGAFITKAHEKALELNKKFPGLEITWREIASLPTPDGVKVTIDTSADDNADQPAGGKKQTQDKDKANAA